MRVRSTNTYVTDYPRIQNLNKKCYHLTSRKNNITSFKHIPTSQCASFQTVSVVQVGCSLQSKRNHSMKFFSMKTVH